MKIHYIVVTLFKKGSRTFTDRTALSAHTGVSIPTIKKHIDHGQGFYIRNSLYITKGEHISSKRSGNAKNFKKSLV